MDSMEVSERVQDLLSVLDGSDEIFLSRWDRPRTIRHKGTRDLVTDTDLAIEAYLKEHLRDVVPGANFMAEESAADCDIILISFPVFSFAPSKISPRYLPGTCFFLACGHLPEKGDDACFIPLMLPEGKASGQSVMARAADSRVLSGPWLMRGLAEREECRKFFENKSEIWKARGASSAAGMEVAA